MYIKKKEGEGERSEFSLSLSSSFLLFPSPSLLLLRLPAPAAAAAAAAAPPLAESPLPPPGQTSRRGVDELPGAVWLFGGGESDDGSGSGASAAPSFRVLRRIDLSGNPGLKKICGIGRGAAMPALREVVVDRGVRVEEKEEVEEEGEEGGGGGGRREGGQAVEVVEV